jgi:hypothetical protein
MAIWRTADSGLGGFTGGQGDVLGGPAGGVNVINAGGSAATGQGGTMAQGGMDMQGFLGMLMQFLRRYQGGGQSMQPGQFPPPTGQMPQPMPQQAGPQVYTPQNPSDWQQYSRPPRQAPQRSQFPTSGPEAGGAFGNVFTTDMFGGGDRQPYQAPPTQEGMGLTLSR